MGTNRLSTAGINHTLLQKLEDARVRKRQRDSNANDEAPQKIKVINLDDDNAPSKIKVIDLDDDNVQSANDQVEGSKESADSNAPQKVKAIDEMKRMNMKQLREEASTRGISASSRKKGLLGRICANNDNGPESDDGGTFVVYNRPGRVGVAGHNKLSGPHTSQLAPICNFEKKFSHMTKNSWINRKKFVSHPQSYTSLGMKISNGISNHYNGNMNKPPGLQKWEHTTILRPQDSKLDARIANFISLIYNGSMTSQQTMEIGDNAGKLPLGTTISKGYAVLKRIADVIGQADRMTLEQLSREFYNIIPHYFDFQKTSSFIIDTPQKLKCKFQMVEALDKIERATTLSVDDSNTEDPLFSNYRQLHCELLPLEVHSEEYSMIQRYLKNTHIKMHSTYDVDIVQLFKVSREGEAERFKKFSGTKNRMLLWHGSPLKNWTGILSQGLRMAPPGMRSYTFGRGIYFADMFSKSATYCRPTQDATPGVLVLCEVALGDMLESTIRSYNAHTSPLGKLSTKLVGRTAPDFSKLQILEDGVVVPIGGPKVQPSSTSKFNLGSFLHNEYIVYNEEQIRMRYLVHVNFGFKPLPNISNKLRWAPTDG